MPRISTTAGSSARGFGLFGQGVTTVTTTFTSSTTWTAPAGVSNLSVVSGRGSNGQPDYYVYTTIGSVTVQALNGSYVLGPLDWSTAVSDCQALVDTTNSGGSGPRTVNPGSSATYLIRNTTNLYLKFISSGSTYQVNGTAVLSNPSGAPTSGTVTYTDVVNLGGIVGFLCNVDVLNAGPAGTASTGFGQTFPGGAGSGGTAPITVFNNVAVTPGTTYTITIPTDNVSPYITIQYTAPA